MQISRTNRRGFTLTELLVVLGLIAVLVSLLLPVVGRARAAAQAAACLSNIRQMGMAWTVYVSENRGRLLDYQSYNPAQPERAYRGYWTGMLDDYKVGGNAVLCPAADEPIPFKQIKGYGNVNYAWTGKYESNGSVARFNESTFRESSYGYNQYLTAGGGYGVDQKATKLASVKNQSEVPVFLDATYLDFKPHNGSPISPAPPPPNLRGDSFPEHDHWKFLIARHGRGVNAYFVDGSARRIPLEETYMLQWNSRWIKYTLDLPKS
jgi:prepilin-type N-terminal cleavage/methylation domain-containing protein/prepilin-type processing-associated H-X9-DG protein